MILLTNIGSRNITYKGKVYQDSEHRVNGLSFLDWSRQLLENYEKTKDDIALNIINPLVLGDIRPTRIYLFYSNQSQFKTRTDQDTLYVAVIIQKLLSDRHGYQIENIYPEHIKAKVIDNAGLLKYYQKIFNGLVSKYPDEDFTICDAGGTAQAKMAMKVMAEYIFPKDKYRVKYVEKNEIVSDVNVQEYRKIINKEEAIRLIKTGEYNAAAELLDYEGIELYQFLSKKEWQKKIFAFVYWKFYGNADTAQIIANDLNAKSKLLTNYGKVPYFGTDFPVDLKLQQSMVDKLHKALFFHSIGRYSDSVLSLSTFYEELFKVHLNTEYPKAEYGSPDYQDDNQAIKFKKSIRQSIPFYQAKDHKGEQKRVNIKDLSLQCMVARQSSHGKIQSIGRLLSPYIEYTDDSKGNKKVNNLRNRIAHNGLFLSESNLEKELPDYDTILSGISTILAIETNDFTLLNDILERNLRSA